MYDPERTLDLVITTSSSGSRMIKCQPGDISQNGSVPGESKWMSEQRKYHISNKIPSISAFEDPYLIKYYDILQEIPIQSRSPTDQPPHSVSYQFLDQETGIPEEIIRVGVNRRNYIKRQKRKGRM